MDVGPGELMIIGLALLLVFGGAKIPQLAKNLGKAKNEFEKGMRGEDEEQPAAATQGAANQSEALPPPTVNGS